MNQFESMKYKTLLMAKRAEITGKSHHREEISIVQSNEQVETVQLAGQREFAAYFLDRQASVLGEIKAALGRIQAGEFGACLDCEEPISAKRLAALPWAAYCVQCQESHDAHEGTGRASSKLAA